VKKLVSIARENLPFWTPAISLLVALQRQLTDIGASGGWPARWERHRRMLGVMESWIAGRSDVRLLAREGARSPAISTLVLPPPLDPARVMSALGAAGYLVGGPLEARHQDVIRIGHMGDLEPAHLSALLDALAEALA
jgi:aspartate aminotransferase-like enzyme